MKTATIISKLILLALFLMPNAILAQNSSITVNGSQIQISSTLQTIFDQAESVYIPSGFTIDGVYKDAPDMIPLFAGLIMQRQKIYMDQTRNLKHVDNYFNLIDQIDGFLSQLAKAHNYMNPVDGSKMPPLQLQTSFMESIQGKYNTVYINKFGINPTTVNIAYLLDSSPNNNIANNDYNNPTNTDSRFTAIQPENNSNVRNEEPLYIELAEEEVPTEINLFGEVSGYAMSGPEVKKWQDASGSKVEGLVCPEKNQSPNTYFFDIDTNNIPNDGTDVRCVYFGKDGPLNEQRPNVNNKQHGVFITYAMNGDIRYLSNKKNYVNGQKHGIEESYTINDNGRHYLSFLDTYANGIKEGVSKRWVIAKNGKISLESVTYYSNNKRNGIAQHYNIYFAEPFLSSKTPYVNGEKNGKEIKYFENGKIQSVYNYKNDKRNGECIHYSKSSNKVSFKCNYKNDKEHGKCISYSPRAGITHCITTYENGVKTSQKCYDPEGDIVRL